MIKLLDKLYDFDESVFRNVTCVSQSLNIFDDLSDDADDWQQASQLVEDEPKIPQELLQYNAIDFVFNQPQWLPSRFGDGSVPIWYGSQELETAFNETAFHWLQTILMDAGFDQREEPIFTARTVFSVKCKSALVDLREKQKQYGFLTQKEIEKYKDTQKLGKKLYRQQVPGFLTMSARNYGGTNIAILNKKILHQPCLYDDFIYKFQSNKSTSEVQVLDLKNIEKYRVNFVAQS